MISLLLGITILTFAVKTETRWAEDEFNYPNGLYENILEEIVIIGVAIAAGRLWNAFHNRPVAIARPCSRSRCRSKDDFYADCVRHPKVLRVVALSGGYSLKEGNDRLRRNHGVVASFSRALVEGLSVQQSDAEYNAVLDATIQSIFEASNT